VVLNYNSHKKRVVLKEFIENTIFNETYLVSELPKRFGNISAEFQKVKELFEREFEGKSESDLEQKLVSHILELLGYEAESQKSYRVQGDSIRPDYTITDENELILLCESKKWGTKLDNGKLVKNPHFQILDYMQKLKLDFSFLTNGRYWRLYDNRKVSFEKRFYEIDLVSLLEKPEDFGYFWYIFRKENFVKDEISDISRESSDFALRVEEDLKSIIYGTNGKSSIFEKIGKAIYRKEKDLEKVFEKSIYFTFRILFVLFFEDRNRDIVRKHQGYKELSFQNIFTDEVGGDDFHILYSKFVKLFEVLDVGSPPHKIPLFNGGLFKRDKILDFPELFGDAELHEILKSLVYFDISKRDFKTLSVINLGSIYEGLLEYRFRVAEEDLYYAEERYLDSYDFHNSNLTEAQFYPKGELFLSNSNNSRKESASYYTPETVSSFMVQSAIDRELQRKSPLEIRIIDNACGSGHFLVEALDYLAVKSLEKPKEISEVLEKERSEILENLKNYKIDFLEISDSQILKRVLLKKAIFGVDLNPFAVEISKLALWIDSFIFGTPLSLIEHHVKVGNSLIGTSVSEFRSYFQKENSLFDSELVEKFRELKSVSKAISEIEDTTEEKVLKSKELFETSSAKMEELNHYLNFVTTKKIKEIEKLDFGNDPEIEDILQDRNSEISQEIDEYAKKFNFFNYEVEFAEVFDENRGFDIVIGNPPWEKVKFDEKDFFPKFKREYRTLSSSQKKKISKELLESDEVRREYETRKEMFDKSNEFLVSNYPLNRGVGDSNLFRFFVEKNLGLLKKEGNLTYVLPSALFQDDGSITLRKHILENFQLNFFFSFENRRPVFPDVDSRYKFAVMQLENGKTEKIKTLFYATDPKDLRDKKKHISYSLKTIKTIAPHHLNLFEIRSKCDLKIVRKAYRRFQSLDSNYFDFRSEIHMTADKEIFHENETSETIPLFEGKMIHQFNSSFAKGKYFLIPEEFDAHILLKEISRLVSDIFPQLPENFSKFTKDRAVIKYLYDIDTKRMKKEEKKKTVLKLQEFVRFDREFLRVGYREIARDTDERTVIATLFPKDVGASNTTWSEIPKKYILKNRKVEISENSLEKRLFLLSIWNSIVFDFLARQIVQIHVTKSLFTRLPTPQPENFSDFEPLIENSKKLLNFYSGFDFEVKTPKNRKGADMVQIENDILVAKMYGISKSELEYILLTFKVLNSKQKGYVEMLKSKFSEEE
jgi:predicted RNA methylase